MFYFPNLNVVFAPIERCASRSIESYLFQHDPDGYRLGTHRHSCSASELTGISPSKIYVPTRHPWTRLCSMYSADVSRQMGGYGIFWTTMSEYLDFYIANIDTKFLDDYSIIPNLFSPMNKLIDNQIVHMYRSQYSYLSALPENIIKLRYEDIPSITGESWSNPAIEFPDIGDENNSSIEYSEELENKLRTLWMEDFNGY